MLKKYPDKVKLVFKNFPLRNHKFARKAAAAALAANRQGKFLEFQARLFKNFNRLSDKKIQEFARELSLNEEEFQKDMKASKILAMISEDIQDGERAGVRGTPTIFINGRLLRQRSVEGFRVIIEKELAKFKKGDL